MNELQRDVLHCIGNTSLLPLRNTKNASYIGPDQPLKIALIAEYDPTYPPHPATSDALTHAAKFLGISVLGQWLSTEDIDLAALTSYSALWIAPGSPYKNLLKTVEAIRFARENRVPCLGTCGGFQHILIEYARNVLGYSDAQHAEYDARGANLFISALACSPAGQQMQVRLMPGAKVARCYGKIEAVEQYYCNFGVNPDIVPLLAKGPMQVVGTDAEGAVRVLELPEHPFFLATLFVPQARSTFDGPHPIITAFVTAALEYARNHSLTGTVESSQTPESAGSDNLGPAVVTR